MTDKNISYGSCEKHPNFPLADCPQCDIDKAVADIESRIQAGRIVISQAKQQLKNLYAKKNAYENLRHKYQQP